MTNLINNAMLVKLNVSQWTARKFDRKVTSEIEKTYAANDSGRFNKILIAQEAIKKVQKTANIARMFHYENTLPWSDSGSRLLPSKNYMDYTYDMRSIKADFEDSVNDLIGTYPELVEEAKIRLNGMFNNDDYPDISELENKYRFHTKIDPIPTSDDFRINLKQEEVDKIKQEIDDRALDAQKVAMKDLWDRLHKTVSHMADTLKEEDKTFKNSLIGNISDLCALLPKLNIDDCPELESMRNIVESKLCTYDVKDLREDINARREATREAKDILSVMGAYMGE